MLHGLVSQQWYYIKAAIVHSRIKLHLSLHGDCTSEIKVNSNRASYICSANLIIWDEAHMANMNESTCINHLLKDTMNNNVPFMAAKF